MHRIPFAISVAGRGFSAHIATGYDIPLPDSACVYCGNCIGVCPTGALMFKSEYDMRQSGTWDETRQVRHEPICLYCGWGAISPFMLRMAKSFASLRRSITALPRAIFVLRDVSAGNSFKCRKLPQKNSLGGVLSNDATHAQHRCDASCGMG